MKCANCDSEDLVFLEETMDKRSYFAKLFTAVSCAVLGIVGAILLIESLKNLDFIMEFFGIACLVLIPIALVGCAIYTSVVIKTSRTKIICKNCGMWWYLENDKPNTIYFDKND